MGTAVVVHDPQPGAVAALIDRDEERALLRDCCLRAEAGTGGVVLIGGEAGIGKTTLALAAPALVPRGAVLLIGRSYDLMETPPYGPWRACFRPLADRADAPAMPFHAGGEPPTRAALFDQIPAALTGLARAKTVLLLLDDIQWADPASLDLLRHVAHHCDGQRLLILCTYRTDELTADHPLIAFFARLTREAPVTRLLLSRFDLPRVAEMVAAQFGGGWQMHALGEAIHRTTAGNPLFVRELCRALVAARAVRRTADGWTVHATTLPAPPESVQELVGARIARLTAGTRHVLEVAAIIGQTFTFPLLAAVLSEPDEAVLAALEEAARAHMIAEDDAAREQYGFTHPIIHEVFYHTPLATRRRQWHRRIGVAIAATAPPDDATVYDRLAHHFGQAHDGARAVRYLTLAGDAAMRLWARATAIGYYEDALALIGATPSEERDHLLLKLSGALAYADPLRRQRYAEEALRGFVARGDLAGAGRIRWRLASGHWRFGRYAQAEEESRRAMEALEQAVGAEATVAVGPLLLTALRDQGRYAEAIAQGHRLLAVAAGGADRDSYYDLLHFTGHAHAAVGEAEAAHALMTRGMEGQRALDNPYTTSSFLVYLFFAVGLPYYADRAALLESLVRQYGEVAERGRVQVGAPVAAGWYLPAYWDFLRGDWQRARHDLRTMPDPPPTSVMARMAWAVCAAEFARAEGRAADGIALIQRQLPPPGADWGVPHHLHLRALHLRAHLALMEGQPAAAKEALDAGAALLAAHVYVPAVAEHHLAWAAYHRARGQAPRAATSAATARDEAARHHDQIALAAAHRTLGEMATERGAWQHAAAELTTAREIAARLPAAHERAAIAIAHAALATLRTDRHDRSENHRALEAADTLVAALGTAAPLAMQRDALRHRLDAINPAQAYGITAREADVLRHLVAGLSNAEIADTLSISRRTVDQHVSSILGKLGVANRVAATSLALERGLVS